MPANPPLKMAACPSVTVSFETTIVTALIFSNRIEKGAYNEANCHNNKVFHDYLPFHITGPSVVSLNVTNMPRLTRAGFQ